MKEYKRTAQVVNKERNDCIDNGWFPLPVMNAKLGDKTTGKNPNKKGWEEKARRGNTVSFDEWRTNTGILCDGMFTLDVDLNDAAPDAADLSKVFMQIIADKFGKAAIVRRRANSSRFLTVFRVATSERLQTKIKVENKTTGHAVEVLATGQQFVAFGFHWEVGAELTWDNNLSPKNLNFADLPELTEHQIFDFMDRCRDVLGGEYTHFGARKADKKSNSSIVESHSTTPPATVNATIHASAYNPMTMDDLADLLDNLPGATDYDRWLWIMSAIYNVSVAAGYDAYQLADKWSAKACNYDAAGVAEKWQEIAKGAATHHDAGYLINQIKAANPLWVSPTYKPRNTGVRYPHGFSMTEEGLYYQSSDDGEETRKPMFICSKFEVIGEATNESGNETGILIKFQNRDVTCSEMIGKSELHDTSNDFIKRLAGKGLTVALGKAGSLKQFFNFVVAPRFVHTGKSGWHGNSFLLSDGSEFNPEGIASPVIMDPAKISVSRGLYAANGSLADWQTGVAALAAGNPSVAFQICAAFAGPLLDVTNVSGGGFHFHGNSRAGKSTALKMAASVFGRPDAAGQVRSWRTTDNSLEAIAEQTNDQTLLLDEISQCDNPKTIGQAAYMLANGAGKGRANQRGNAREIKTFRVLFLSNGERTLDNMMDAENSGKIKNAGIGVRMADIPMSELSVHFNLHGFPNLKALMDAIPERIKQNHGCAGKAFLSKIVELRSADEAAFKECIHGVMDQFTKSALVAGSNPQVASICQRFALVAAAGELAIELDVLPWVRGEAISMAKLCFDACIFARDEGTGGSEEYKAIELIKEYIQVHEAKFQDVGAPYPPPICHGYRDDAFVYFNSTGFKAACAGMDQKYVAKILHEHGFLKKAKESNYNAKIYKSWANKQRFYQVDKIILSSDE